MRDKSLKKDILYNVVGLSSPMVVAVLTMPVIIKKLGIDRFGVLSLSWMVLGYFSLFDLGLGRALTKLVAEKIGSKSEWEIPELVWSSIILMCTMGLVGTAVLFIISPLLIQTILKIPTVLKDETLVVFYLLACSIPVVIISTGLRGVLEAKRHFLITNAIRIPMGVLTFLSPLLVLSISNSLVVIVAVLLAVRFVALLAYLFCCLQLIPDLRSRFSIRRSALLVLLKFGGWMTVSNLISPLLIYLDRLLIGSLISMAALAYYSTPWELVMKVLLIPGAMAGVLFPVFSTAFIEEAERAAHLYRRGIKYLFFLLFPITLIIVIFAKEGLTLWLGVDFAQHSYRVLQLLALGVLLNGLASIPFAFIQGMGKPYVTAKFHVIELVFYVPCAWLMISKFGIIGAAFAWMLRVSIDAILLHNFSARYLVSQPGKDNHFALHLVLSISVLLVGLSLFSVIVKIVYLGVVMLVFSLLVWRLFFDDVERYTIMSKLGLMK